MDSLEEYRNAIVRVFDQWTRFPGPEARFEIVPVIDRERDRYVLLDQGWDGYQRIHGCLVHIDIIDGKIWIQEDDTEEGIATELVREGVPKDRIVLAFHHPSLRKLGEFAVA